MYSSRTLNIFFSVDKNYIIHFTVALTSLLENNKDLDIVVYIIHDLEDVTELKSSIIFFEKKYSAKLILKELDNEIFNNFHISDYISKATYFRLLFADIIPENVFSGLSIDCDTIITGSLKYFTEINSFKNENSEESYLFAVRDKNESNEIERLEKLGINTNIYFNAGVMYLNLKKWRQENISPKLISIAQKYKNYLKWHDQDVMNMYFKNKCRELDSSYNKFTEQKQQKTPIIIHYSGASKPWHYFNSHPYKFLYWKYLKLTPFKKTVFEKVTVEMIMKKYFWKINDAIKQNALNIFPPSKNL